MRTFRCGVGSAGLCAMFAVSAAVAQDRAAKSTTAPLAKLPSYDVSTIRPNVTGSGDVSVNTRPATLEATNVSLKDVFEEAFDVRRNQIFGLPDWAEKTHYDINAKVVDPDIAQLRALSHDQRRTMLRVLYEDRFRLKWHFESRVLPDYELVVAKNGPKLKQVPTDSQHTGISMNNYDATFTANSMANLADMLSHQQERPVVDKTGLTGTYDFRLTWTPDTARDADAGQDANASPPLFTALQEQLGLKLQPGKDPVQTLVIDSISPPTDN